jgi:hypothetical protein
MPSESDERVRNLTLRLPEDYHRQLSNQSARGGISLNAHLISIVQHHLRETGYWPDVIKSLSGRLFEIVVEDIPREKHGGSYFCSRFDVYESHPLYNKRRAHYVFGVQTALIGRADPYGLVKDVGAGLLNFFNRQGLEIDQLAWQPGLSDPSPPGRILADNWRFIGSDTTGDIQRFLIALSQNYWKDELVSATGVSQDLRHNLRTEDDLYR